MNLNELIGNDEHLKEIAKRDPFAQDHLSVYLRVYSSRKQCENCAGLHECTQASAGQRLDLSYDGFLNEEIEYCGYALKQKEDLGVLKKYLYCDIPVSLSTLDLANLSYADVQEELYLALASILHDRRDKGLYIYGDLGVGKTYLCAALANSLVKKGKKVAFVKVSDFFNRMKAAIGTDPEGIDRNMALLKKADCLFLDDIGSESVSEFVRDDILFPILDHRLENGLMTVFTSNLSKEELLTHYRYDRREKSNLMNARRLLERIDILSDDFVLSGSDMRRK